MASHKLFRGYVYAGFCLVSSLLLIINSVPMIKVSENTTYETGPYHSSYYQPSRIIKISASAVSTTCVISLVISVISTVFTLGLLFGMMKRRVNFVTSYIMFLSTFYVTVMIVLFIGCIVCGILVGNYSSTYDIEKYSGLVVLTTVGFCILLLLVTLFYCLGRWILNGVIDHIKHDISRLDSAKGIVPEYEDCF